MSIVKLVAPDGWFVALPQGYVPWCPENCVLTEWSEWGGCGATCVPTLVSRENSILSEKYFC